MAFAAPTCHCIDLLLLPGSGRGQMVKNLAFQEPAARGLCHGVAPAGAAMISLKQCPLLQQEQQDRGGRRTNSINLLCSWSRKHKAMKCMGKDSGVVQHVEVLEKRLEKLLEENPVKIVDEVLLLMGELEKQNPNPDASACPDLFNGDFQMLGSNAPGVSIGNTLSLGLLSFGAFKPGGLKLRLDKLVNHVDEPSQLYSIASHFTIQEEDEGQPPLMGCVTNSASICAAEGTPNMYNMRYNLSTLAPVPDATPDAKRRWMDIFGPHYPEMDDTGLVAVTIAPSPVAIKITYLSRNLRINQGHFTVNGKMRIGNKYIQKRVSH